MADFNPIFEVHAGKILAKLHLAGQQQANNSVVINTAIKNPVDKADPQNPGKTEFDLENKSGEYQLAIIRPLIYQVPIDLEKNKNLQKLFQDLEKAKEKAGKDKEKEEKKEGKEGDKKEDAHADESLTAKTKDKDDKTNESMQSRKSLMRLLFEDVDDGDDIEDREEDDKDDGKKKEVDPEVKKIQDAILKEFESYTKDKNSFKHGEYEADEEDFEASVKSFKQAIQDENKGRQDDKEKAKDELKKNATEDMFTYFTTFAGKDNAKKINPKEIVLKNADADGKEADSASKFDKIKDYKIEVADVDEAIKKAEEQIQEKKPNDWMKHNVALIVGYKVDID